MQIESLSCTDLEKLTMKRKSATIKVELTAYGGIQSPPSIMRGLFKRYSAWCNVQCKPTAILISTLKK